MKKINSIIDITWKLGYVESETSLSGLYNPLVYCLLLIKLCASAPFLGFTVNN